MGDARREQQRGGRPPGTKPTRAVARAIMARGAALAVEHDVWEGGQPPRFTFLPVTSAGQDNVR